MFTPTATPDFRSPIPDAIPARRVISLLFVAVLSILPAIARGQSMGEATAVEISRAYLASHSRAERRQLAAKLAEFQGDWAAVVKQLVRKRFRKPQPGICPRSIFRAPICSPAIPTTCFISSCRVVPARSPGRLDYLFARRRRDHDAARPSRHARFPIGKQSGRHFPIRRHVCRDGHDHGRPLRAVGHEHFVSLVRRGADEYLSDVIRECKHALQHRRRPRFLTGPFDGRIRRISPFAPLARSICRGDREFRIVVASLLAGDFRHARLHGARRP